ncbi:MAG: DMT family transporter [Actinomycetes bacterium]
MSDDTAEPDATSTHPSGSSPAGISAAVTAVVVWGLGNALIKGLDLNGLALSFYRLGLGAMFYAAILYGRGGRLTRDSFRFGWQGGIAFGSNIATFFVALHLTTVAIAVTVSALQPIVIVGFAALLFGERIRPAHIVWTVVAVAGVAAVTFGASTGGTASTVGNIVAVISLFTWAWYFVASKRAREQLDTLEYMTVMLIVAFLAVAPFSLVTGSLTAADGQMTWAKFGGVWLIVLLPGSGHVLINWAHAHTTLLLTSLVTLAIPVISAAAAAVFLSESVSTLQWAGMAVVLVALAAVVIDDARVNSRAATLEQSAEPGH